MIGAPNTRIFFQFGCHQLFENEKTIILRNRNRSNESNRVKETTTILIKLVLPIHHIYYCTLPSLLRGAPNVPKPITPMNAAINPHEFPQLSIVILDFV